MRHFSQKHRFSAGVWKNFDWINMFKYFLPGRLLIDSGVWLKTLQEGRRAVVAEYQHIVYREWLPIVLGNNFMRVYGLNPLSRVSFDQIWCSFCQKLALAWKNQKVGMVGMFLQLWTWHHHIIFEMTLYDVILLNPHKLQGSLIRLQRHLRPPDQQWVCCSSIQVCPSLCLCLLIVGPVFNLLSF